jgi:hypothetical protein
MQRYTRSCSRLGNGNRDGFVAKLNADGSGLAHATYLGGSHLDWAQSIAVDSGRNVYVTGETISDDFPITLLHYGGSRSARRPVLGDKQAR